MMNGLFVCAAVGLARKERQSDSNVSSHIFDEERGTVTALFIEGAMG